MILLQMTCLQQYLLQLHSYYYLRLFILVVDINLTVALLASLLWRLFAILQLFLVPYGVYIALTATFLIMALMLLLVSFVFFFSFDSTVT